YNTDGYGLLLMKPFGGGVSGGLGVRRIYVYETDSSRKIGRTPYRQQAGMTRYEYVASAAFRLLEGRSFTRFSPMLPDFKHVLHLTAAIHYSHPTRTTVPRKNDPPVPMAGQEPVNSKIVPEVGLRWQIYLPSAIGIYFEASKHWSTEP